MNRTTTTLAGLGAAGALFLAGCGGSGTTTATSAPSSAAGTSASATTSSASTSSASSSSAGSSSASSTSSSDSESSSASSAGTNSSLSLSSVSATTTVGGDTTTLDAQSTTWFDTMCTGLAPLTQFSSSAASLGDDPSKIGPVFVEIGESMTSTAATLQDTPPPTFEGGEAVATQFIDALTELGPAFADLGTKAGALDPANPAGAQEFAAGLQSIATQAQGLTAVEATDAVKKAVAAIPSCSTIFGQS